MSGKRHSTSLDLGKNEKKSAVRQLRSVDITVLEREASLEQIKSCAQQIRPRAKLVGRHARVLFDELYEAEGAVGALGAIASHVEALIA